MNHELNKYPYFIYHDVLALRNGTADKEETTRLRRRIAANVGDIPSLRLILGIDPQEFGEFYPDSKKVNISTLDTIESFISHFGGRPGTSTPISKTDPPDKELAVTPPTASRISETDARIMIKKHNYQQALEIILQLSLKNPEKSIYFADQIRFLRKLILNEAKRNKT